MTQNTLLPWTVVRGFGNSRLASFTILMPFIGYVILYHEAFAPYLNGVGGLLDAGSNQEILNLFDLSTIERLHYIYLGSVLVGIASILYRLFVPDVCRRFPDEAAYISDELSRITAKRASDLFLITNRFIPCLTNELKARAPYLEHSMGSYKLRTDSFSERNDDQEIINLLLLHYHVNQFYIRYPAKWLVFALYVSGFVLLLVPSVDFLFRVLVAILL